MLSLFSNTPSWHKITETPLSIVWQTNNMCIVEVAGKKITLGKFQDQIFAFAQKANIFYIYDTISIIKTNDTNTSEPVWLELSKEKMIRFLITCSNLPHLYKW